MKLAYNIIIFASLIGVQVIGFQQINNENSLSGGIITRHVTNIINNAIYKAENAKTELLSKFHELSEYAENKIGNLLATSYAKIEQIVDQAKSEIHHDEKAVNDVSACWKRYQPDLNQAVEDSKNEAKQCLVTAKDEILGIRDEIKKYTDAVENEILKLYAIAQKCIKPLRPIYTLRCVTKNVGAINKSVLSILHNGRRAITRATLRIIQITDVAQECLELSVGHAEERIRGVAKKIVDCIVNGEPTTPAPSTTAAPTTTTTTPTSTAAPTTTTAAPTTTTAAPTITTEAATTVQPTEAPTSTAAPTETTEAATTVQPTETPTSTAAPTETTEAATTVQPTETPASTAAPTESTEASTTEQPTEAPSTTSDPTENTEGPTDDGITSEEPGTTE